MNSSRDGFHFMHILSLYSLPKASEKLQSVLDLHTMTQIHISENPASKSNIQNFVANEDDLRLLKTAAVEHVGHKTNSVLSDDMIPLPKHVPRASFGCKALDKCSSGGIAIGEITEVIGEENVGKTQLLLQLGITAQLPVHVGGLSKGVVFVTTEGKEFRSKRLMDFGKYFEEKFSELDFEFRSRIFLEYTKSNTDLLDCLSQRLPQLVQSGKIGLIIINSLDYNACKQSQYLRKLTQAMFVLANEHKCGIVCINEPNRKGRFLHFGRTRVKISQIPKQVRLKGELMTVRKFEIVYSPESPNETAEFLITPRCICGVVNKGR